jgi:hypothetical protein
MHTGDEFFTQETPMKSLHRVAFAAALALGSSTSFAALQTLTGTTFSVTFDDTLVGLFGTPTLRGNALQWFPSGSPGFSTTSSGGITSANSTFALMITALPGYALSGFNLTEAGDYFAFAGSGSTAQVAVGGQLRVTPLGGSTQLASIVAGAPFTSTNDFAAPTLDWSATAAVTPLTGTVMMANVSIQNLLRARVTGSDGFAFVEKKEAFLSVSTSPIPEPETYVLLLSGLGVVLFLGRRRSLKGY